MKKSLKFAQHLMKAKGRHGTHSPFVYAFVEEVLRKKNKKQSLFTDDILPAKQQQLLANTIAFLKPERIVLFGNNATAISKIAQSSGIEVQIANTNTFTIQHNDVIIADVELAKSFLSNPEIQQAKQLAILLHSPHSNADTERIWSELIALEQFNMTLDYWHFGLLMSSPDFKIKQHFLLR